MAEENGFYTVYKYGDRLEPGKEITINHNISFSQSRADLSALVSLPPDELKGLRLVSEEKEKKIFEKLCTAVEEWEQQAAQTLLLGKAQEYVKTPAVKHNSNQWKGDERGDSFEVSNMVYKMSYRIREDTQYNRALRKTVPCAWYVTWSVAFNAPSKGDYYSNSARNIAGQEQKRYTDKAAAERYVQGRIDAYAHLFTELSPPIPEDKKNFFCVNGHLLPSYSVKSHEPTALELLSFVEEQDITAAGIPVPMAHESKPAPNAQKQPAPKKALSKKHEAPER